MRNSRFHERVKRKRKHSSNGLIHECTKRSKWDITNIFDYYFGSHSRSISYESTDCDLDYDLDYDFEIKQPAKRTCHYQSADGYKCIIAHCKLFNYFSCLPIMLLYMCKTLMSGGVST